MARPKSPVQKKQVSFRMPPARIRELDALCKANQRARAEIVSMLVQQAAAQLKFDPASRITL